MFSFFLGQITWSWVVVRCQGGWMAATSHLLPSFILAIRISLLRFWRRQWQLLEGWIWRWSKFHFFISLSKHQSVSECVCLFVCLFPNSEILRDDFPLDWEGFKLKNILIRRTVSWKIACILAPHSTLAVCFILSSMNL